MKTKIAALALAASSIAGIGSTIAANDAGAYTKGSTNTAYVHYSAKYASMADCNYWRSAVANRINSTPNAHTRWTLACKAIGGNRFSYDHISYNAFAPLNAGDVVRTIDWGPAMI